ncbi:MAG: type II toxin-antitoxin system VapC family toxin [Rhizobiaceae bacterium]|nr:type II toxin-antitoxin system VapC family toxin [Rhizobiaceae bacterium]
MLRRIPGAKETRATSMVLESRLGEPGGSELDLWLHRINSEIVAVSADHSDQARRAWRRYGKGRHAAGLNLSDCFSYALAKLTSEPLLFKGDDFSQTDILAATANQRRYPLQKRLTAPAG